MIIITKWEVGVRGSVWLCVQGLLLPAAQCCCCKLQPSGETVWSTLSQLVCHFDQPCSILTSRANRFILFFCGVCVGGRGGVWVRERVIKFVKQFWNYFVTDIVIIFHLQVYVTV